MATQIEKVFVKKESDADFTELEKIYIGDELIFQKSPTGYNYERIVLAVAPSGVEGIWYVRNTSSYTINVGWSIGTVGTYGPGVMATFPVGAIPIWIQVNGLPQSSTGQLDIYNYFADCPVSYKYLRKLYVD